MRKLNFVAILMTIMMMVGCTTSVGRHQQKTGGLMGGRIAPDSPTDFNSGVNKVHFFSEGTKVVGNLLVPKSYKKGQKLPIIVVVGPRGSVKEQTQGIYAEKLTDKGFLSFAFDHRTYGESGGEPRHYENPYMKIEDAKNAISYVASLDIVDKDKILLLGVCNGGGYATAAAVYDKRIKAYASVSGLFDLRSLVINGKPDDKKRFASIMKKSGEARQKYFETGEVEYQLQIADIDENSNQLRKEAYDYYWTARGLVPNYGENKMVVFSLDSRVSFDITDQIGLLAPTPYLAIAGTKALTNGMSKRAYKRANEPKELFEIEGASHVDLYDIDKYVDPAVNKLNDFYSKTIN